MPEGEGYSILSQANSPKLNAMVSGDFLQAHQSNSRYYEEFNRNVVQTGSEMRKGGQVTTMRLASVGHKDPKTGKVTTYLVPMFDPKTGKVEEDTKQGHAKALARVMPDIKSGKLKGYDNHVIAEASRQSFYPRIIEKFKNFQSGGFKDLIKPTGESFNRVIRSLEE